MSLITHQIQPTKLDFANDPFVTKLVNKNFLAKCNSDVGIKLKNVRVSNFCNYIQTVFSIPEGREEESYEFTEEDVFLGARHLAEWLIRFNHDLVCYENENIVTGERSVIIECLGHSYDLNSAIHKCITDQTDFNLFALGVCLALYPEHANGMQDLSAEESDDRLDEIYRSYEYEEEKYREAMKIAFG